MSKSIRGSLTLLLVAILWGFAFVAQSDAMNDIGPFTYQGTRMLLAAVTLIPVAAVVHFGGKARDRSLPRAFLAPGLLWRAAISGAILFLASGFQQIGIKYTSVGHAGFLSTVYIFIIPVLGLLFGKKVGAKLWICMGVALAGLWLLCMTGESFSMGMGDVLVLVSSLFFALHIMSLDLLAKEYDGIQYCAVQMLAASILHIICAFIFEQPSIEGICAATIPIAYSGFISGGIAYTLQIVGQKHTHPTVASIIMSLEGVFAAVGGALILHEALSPAELIGCILMFSATVMSQIEFKKRI
ncbi:MAG: DMT family transporter [Clostridia bacterium]|nr:DMT family transporter [Clostridia bacterium]